MSEAVAAISGKPPMITRALLDDVAGGVPLFTIDKARSELGYTPRSGEEAVTATVEWARTMKWI